MHKIKHLITCTLFLPFLLISCNKNKVEPLAPIYWKKAFYMGNLKINNQDIPTYSDVSTTNQIADYVKISDLSDDPIENISINLYIPTDTSLFTITMSEEMLSIVATPSVTSQISSAGYKYNTMIDSTKYAVFELIASCSPMSKNDFTNIKFSARFDYKREDGTQETRLVESNIFKKN